VSARKRLALFLLCLASFIAVVDTTIVSIALPSMRRELGFTGADAQWILNGYALTFGGGLYACAGFAVLALPVVVMGLPRGVASEDRRC
jgi:MFS family permease